MGLMKDFFLRDWYLSKWPFLSKSHKWPRGAPYIPFYRFVNMSNKSEVFLSAFFPGGKSAYALFVTLSILSRRLAVAGLAGGVIGPAIARGRAVPLNYQAEIFWVNGAFQLALFTTEQHLHLKYFNFHFVTIIHFWNIFSIIYFIRIFVKKSMRN